MQSSLLQRRIGLPGSDRAMVWRTGHCQESMLMPLLDGITPCPSGAWQGPSGLV